MSGPEPLYEGVSHVDPERLEQLFLGIIAPMRNAGHLNDTQVLAGLIEAAGVILGTTFEGLPEAVERSAERLARAAQTHAQEYAEWQHAQAAKRGDLAQ